MEPSNYLHVRGTGPFEVRESDTPAPDGWQRVTRAEYAAMLAAYTPLEPEPAPATADDIKAVAHRRILEIAPIWRQMNMTARTLDLTNEHGADPAQWPAEAKAERDSYAVIYARILAVRAHSDALELNPPALADLATAGWPE